MTLPPPDQQSIRDAIAREESRLLRIEEELGEGAGVVGGIQNCTRPRRLAGEAALARKASFRALNPYGLMHRKEAKRKRKGKRGVTRRSKARLDMLVAEATVDCYNESEQVTGLYTMIEENLGLPFETTVLGVPVTVQRVDMTQREEIVAVCHRAGVRQAVPILDLPLPSPRPDGAEWIDAYRHWLGAKMGCVEQLICFPTPPLLDLHPE